MNSRGTATPEEILEALGDKVAGAITEAVQRTKNDLREYRLLKPEWTLRHSKRGLANWIQDHLWYHLCDLLEGSAEVLAIEHGITRELMVNDKYRMRIKRQHLDGRIGMFLTQAALEFLNQPDNQLPGLESVNLVAGYEWDSEIGEIIRPIISLRDGMDNILWTAGLPELGDKTDVSALPARDIPPAPEVLFPEGKGAAESEADDS